MSTPKSNQPDEERQREERFAAKLEAVDDRLAGQRGDGDAGDAGDDVDDTLDSEIAGAAAVLDLINRVRKGEADTGRQQTSHADTAGEETFALERRHVDREPSEKLPLTDQQIGSCRVLEQIARGGMGVVFRAHDLDLNRFVAIKMMLAGPFATNDERNRFRGEAEAAARLDHPGIVPIYEVGEHQSQPYFTMGLVEGESLSERVRREPLRPRDAGELAMHIAAAVQYAHENGIIHRDIKPANVLLGRDGKPRLTDFGLARRTDSASDLTGTGQVLGTPSYMAPEQAAGNASAASFQADVYSIGATLYCALTGRPPFQAASAVDTLRMVIEQDPLAPHQLNSNVPVDLSTICVKCLQKDPHRRYESAAELEADLSRFLQGVPISARPIGWAERTWKWSRRHPLIATLSATIAASLIAIILGGLWYQAQLNRTLVDLKQSRTETVDYLYNALTNEAEFLNEVRPLGYGTRVIDLVGQARQLESNRVDLQQLRQLAVSSLGHVGARQPIQLPKQEADVTSANVISGSNQLLLGLRNGGIASFDIRSGRQLGTLNVLSEPIVRIDVDQPRLGTDGERIRTFGQFGRQVGLWIRTGDGKLNLESHVEPTLPEGFLGIEPTPDGRFLVGIQSASVDAAIARDLAVPQKWITRSTTFNDNDIAAGRRREQDAEPIFFAVASLVHPEEPVNVTAIEMSPRFDTSDRYLAVGRSWLDDLSYDDSIKTYNLETGELLANIRTDCGALFNVMISRNGSFVACGGHFAAEVFHTLTGQRVARYDTQGACFIESLVGDNGDILVRSKDGLVWFSPQQRQPVARFAARGDGSNARLSSDGRHAIWVGSAQPQVVDLQGHQRRRIAAHERIAKSISFSSDGQLMITTGAYKNGILTRVWNAASGDFQFEFVGSDSVFSPDGRWIASWAGEIKLWDVSTGELAGSVRSDFFPTRIAWNDAGDLVAVCGRFPGQCVAWRLAETQGDPGQKKEIELVEQLRDAEGMNPCALSPSGHRVAYRRGSIIRVHDFRDPNNSLTIDPEGNLLEDSIGFLDDDRLLVIADTLQLWDLPTNQRMKVSSEQRHQPPLVISPDRDYLLCERKVLNTADFAEVFELPAWGNYAVSCGWSPDGRRIAYGLDGGDVTLWDLKAASEAPASQSLPWNGVTFTELPKSDAVSQMILLGRRHSGEHDPQQWQNRHYALITGIDRGNVDPQVLSREVHWLSEHLDNVFDRPFSESTGGDLDWIDRITNVHSLAGVLRASKQYEAEQELLQSMQRAHAKMDAPSPEMIRKISSIYHASGDLHNFFRRDQRLCLDAYRTQEQLLDELDSQAPPAFAPEQIANDRFWMNRNMALALDRFGDRSEAIARMDRALELCEEFTDIQVDDSVMERGYERLRQWLIEAERTVEAEAVGNRRSGVTAAAK